MPYVSCGLYDGRVTFRIGLRAPFVQFPEHCQGFAPDEEVGSLGTRRIGVHGRPLLINRWSISVQRVAFLCNKWGVRFAQQLAKGGVAATKKNH